MGSGGAQDQTLILVQIHLDPLGVLIHPGPWGLLIHLGPLGLLIHLGPLGLLIPLGTPNGMELDLTWFRLPSCV